MVRLGVSVEGPTEQEFCREILRPHLLGHNVELTPIVILTKRIINGPNQKGGAITLQRVCNELRPLIHTFDFVSTFYDFYGFSGRKQNENVDELCLRISNSLSNPPNFIPYIQIYEFEALIFSNPDTVGDYLQSIKVASDLHEAIKLCGSPEQVNDSPMKAPSKRLTKTFDEHLNIRYDKKFHGPLLALAIGLSAVRAACPRFNGWLQRLEALGRT